MYADITNTKANVIAVSLVELPVAVDDELARLLAEVARVATRQDV